MDTRKVDLHVHSVFSDGTLTVSQLMEEAVRQNVSALALTDHDTVDGVASARKAAEANHIEFIPGVELSTEYKGKEVHIVGLFIDETDSVLLQELEDFRNDRVNRNKKMYAALQEEGFDITEEKLQAMFPDSVLTRAHIARYLLEKKYISSMAVAFEKYIGDGCRCYIPRKKITPMEGVELIHRAKGKAIIAHPILYHMSDARLRELISDCKAVGLDGIEAVYSTYQPGDEHYIKRLAKEYDLKLSGGSDFHGTNKPTISLGTGYGHLFVPYEILERLKE